jgi:hypothetical protein
LKRDISGVKVVCMKMWLDDIRGPPIGCIRVKTVKEAKKLLMTGEVEEASLDHDLDIRATIGMEPIEETGYDLVKWMVETGHWPKKKPEVHSMNPCSTVRQT